MEPSSYRAAVLLGVLGSLAILGLLVKHSSPANETMQFFAEEGRNK